MMPDFMAAYFAAVCSVKDGDVAEVEISASDTNSERTVALTITIRRDVFQLDAEP